MLRVIIAHRNSSVSRQLSDLLEINGMSVDADVRGLSELVAKARHWRPHILLLDIKYSGNEFRGFLRSLKESLPGIKLVITGPEPEAYYARHVSTLGANLYLSEGRTPNEWLKRLRWLADQSETKTAGERIDATLRQGRDVKQPGGF
jgi:DNA-binding NarL/FixJ family response regulator